jgi:DegV family protein with EDD domain
MWLTIGADQYRDGELGLDEVTRRLGEGLSTSGPAPGELAEALAQADTGEGAVLLTVSRRMSSVYEAGRLAGGMVGAGRVAVVDTGTAAGAQGLVVLAAARAARQGLPLAGVLGASERASRGARLVATLPALDYLARGGRVPGAAAWAARWLGLGPVFEFRSGVVKALRPARGRQQAYERVLERWERTVETNHVRGVALHVAAMHALQPDAAEEMLRRVRLLVQPVTAFSSPFSAVMVAHTGPGLAGLAWWWEGAEG